MQHDAPSNTGHHRIALIMRGLSYCPSYQHPSGFFYGVDYRRCLANQRANLPLDKSDIYISTNGHALTDRLLQDYKPVAQYFESDAEKLPDPYRSIARHIRRCFAQIRASGKLYDQIIVTRFDILFKYPIQKLRIDPAKFNFLFYAENNGLIDDNFWVFPQSMMDEIDTLLAKIESGEIWRTHDIIRYLEAETAQPLFKGNYTIMKHRPYIKFQRETSRLAIVRKCRIALIHMGITRHNLMHRRHLIDLLKHKLRMPRRELSWRLYAVKVRARRLLGLESSPVRMHFLTFYSEGHPHDKGLDLTRPCRRFLKATRPFVDSVKAISAASLRANPATAIYVKEFDEEAIYYNVGTNKIGFLRWKPYIILEALKKARDGDIILYRDCNVEKYPNLLYKIYNIRHTVEEVLRLCGEDFFAPIENFPRLKVKHNVKREVFDHLGLDFEETKENYLHNASLIICRKSAQSIKMVEEWLALCMDDQLISPLMGPQDATFLHNTQEQAIMNGVILKHEAGKPLSKPVGISVIDRAFSLPQLVKVPRVAVLYSGQLRNFDNEQMMAHNFRNLLSLYQCDVFFSSWENRGYSLNHGESRETNYAQKTDNSQQRIHDLFSRQGAHVRDVELENFEEWMARQTPLIKALYQQGMQMNGKHVYANAFPQFYKIERANALKKRYEQEHGFTYDVVIRFRPDMCLVEEIPAEYMHALNRLGAPQNKIYHLNPPRIFYPNRIYDIFFFGHSAAMDIVAGAWGNIEQLLEDGFDNGLPKVDACRLLYIQAIRHGLEVIDIPRCIGDIYRDEPMDAYIDKILHRYN